MNRPRMSWIVVALLAFPAAAATGARIKLENTSNPGSRVAITFADSSRTPARLETADDGTAQLVVEAPSPRLRLRGGSLQTDPMIDALARQQVRESSPAPNLLVMNDVEQPRQRAEFDGPLVYDDWAGWWGGGYSWGSGYSLGSSWYEPRTQRRWRDVPVAREIPRDRRTARPATPTHRGSSSAREVTPRSRGRR